MTEHLSSAAERPNIRGVVDPGEWPTEPLLKPAGQRAQMVQILGAPLLALLWPFWLAAEAVGRRHQSLAGWALVLDILLYGAGFVMALGYGTRLRPPLRIGLLGALGALGLGFLVLSRPGSQPLVLAYAVVAAVLILPVRWGRLLTLLVAPGMLLITWLVTGAVGWSTTIILVLLAVVFTVLAELNRAIRQLYEARERIRELTIVQERNRFAIDLHDLLGHSLTVITVKTALARRLLETSSEISKVASEVHDIEQLARRARTEIRAAVSGYRGTSLEAEIAHARTALEAAGIDADLPAAADDVLHWLREPFAFVLREGVTNIIRHSGASACTVRLGTDWLEIRDNGPGGAESDGAGGGNGIPGLASRLASVGGRMDAGRLPEGGFLLRAQAHVGESAIRDGVHHDIT